jgi:molybdate transport system regulatory protein
MTQGKIDALLALRSEGRLLIGRDRIRLLEAVVEQGSITQAAQAAGFSYKAAWDAVNAINNLLPRPAFVTRSGGRHGGGAEVTEEGRRLITAFRRLEEKLARISAAIAKDGIESEDELLFWGFAMKTSARNAFHCTVIEVKRAAVNVEVSLRLSESTVMTAVITNDSLEELGIVPGRHVVALVKSSFVLLAQGDEVPHVSARNRIPGTVVERIDGGVNTEIILDIGAGKTLTSVITRESAEDLTLRPGDRACALFKASHVILATD